MGSTSDLKNGGVIKYNNENYVLTNVEFRKPGKGGAFFQVKMRNLLTGKVAEHKYRSGESVQTVRIEKRPYQYLYKDGSMFVFMNNENYDQIHVASEMVGEQYKYMKENDDASLLFEGDTVLAVEIPQHVNLIITETEPGVRGDTATNVTKPAKLETGASVNVPLFINEGDKIRIDTQTGSYIERVKS